jgi:hypothetical protein
LKGRGSRASACRKIAVLLKWSKKKRKKRKKRKRKRKRKERRKRKKKKREKKKLSLGKKRLKKPQSLKPFAPIPLKMTP